MKNHQNISISAALTAILLAGNLPGKAQSNPANDPVFQNIDQSVKPGTDFFHYANGKWLKDNPIPPAYSSWGIGNVVTEDIRIRLQKN